MSNFNLISPVGNGHNFNVRFNEPVIIPENASVSMNWATFERDNKIRFSEVQTITLNPKKVLPYWDWYNNGAGKGATEWRQNGLIRTAGDLTFEIPAGSYSLQDLQAKISQLLGNNTSGKSIFQNNTNILGDMLLTNTELNNPSLVCKDVANIVPLKETNGNSLTMGFMNNMNHTAMAGHATHKHGTAVHSGGRVTKNTAATGGTIIDATSGIPALEASYSSYCLGAKKYIHTGGEFDNFNVYDQASDGKKLKNGGFDELENLNTIVLTSTHDCSESGHISRKGNLFLGLYSEDFAGASDASHLSTAADADRIQGANLKTLEAPANSGYYPKCYMGVELTGADPAVCGADNTNLLRFFVAGDGTTLNDDLNPLSLVAEYPVKEFYGQTYEGLVSFGIQTYYDRKSSPNYTSVYKKDLHYRIFLMGQTGEKSVIFDTNTSRPHIPVGNGSIGSFDPQQLAFSNAFMETNSATADPATITLAQAASSIPFSPIVAMTTQGEGGVITYTQMSDSASNITNSLLLDYTLTLSKEVATLIHPTSTPLELEEKSAGYIDYRGGTSYYNDRFGDYTKIPMNENEFFYRNNSLLGQYLTDKFSVVLNNLPIKSYKNTNDKSVSGGRKPILACIPQPFSNVGQDVGTSGTIIGSYQASLGIMNRLSNQATTTNNFDVSILDLENDRPAEQLTKSIINFTIHAD